MNDYSALQSQSTFRLGRNHGKLVSLSDSEREQAMDRLTLLKSMSFGSQVAEEEIQDLGKYFVQTDQWSRIVSGDIDIVRGEKGAGKSAIYLLLSQHSTELFDRRVLLVNAENPKGSTVFKDLIADPPASEAEFIILWKIYIIVLIVVQMQEYGISGNGMHSILVALQESGLIEAKLNLSGLLRSAQILARRLLTHSRIEAGVELDQTTGAASGLIGRISLAEPNTELRSRGIDSLDGYLRSVNEILQSSGYAVWVLLDRLDVAFAENHELEAHALRALLRVYSDIRSLEKISMKIFLREDIWKRVTEGLREASHLIRYEVVEWSQPTLLNLLLRRLLNNQTLVEEMNLNSKAILADVEKQTALFAALFPAQIEQGPQKAQTFKWMVTRCADGTGKTAPRELIHLIKSIKDQEVRRMERGGVPPPDGQIFDRSVFKAALPIVSDARLKTYIYAEYPSEKPFVEKLYGQKTEHTPESLSVLWNMNRQAAIKKAGELTDLGFFETRGTNSEPTFWIPFLYRDALRLVQGKADTED